MELLGPLIAHASSNFYCGAALLQVGNSHTEHWHWHDPCIKVSTSRCARNIEGSTLYLVTLPSVFISLEFDASFSSREMN